MSKALTTLVPPDLPYRLVISWRNVLPSIAGIVVDANLFQASTFVRQKFRDQGGEGRCFLFSSSLLTCNTCLLPNKGRLSELLSLYACENVQNGSESVYTIL